MGARQTIYLSDGQTVGCDRYAQRVRRERKGSQFQLMCCTLVTESGVTLDFGQRKGVRAEEASADGSGRTGENLFDFQLGYRVQLVCLIYYGRWMMTESRKQYRLQEGKVGKSI